MIKKQHITFLAANMLERLLAKCGPNFKRDVVGYLSLDKASCNESVEIVAPDFVDFDSADLPIFERIIKSYRLAKKDQLKADPVYLPSSLWQGQLDLAYANLYEEKIEKPAFFLSNFGAWPEYTGIENTVFIRNMLSSQVGRDRLKRIFLRLINYWILHEQNDRGFDALSYPSFGNQYGFRFRDHFMGLGSVFSDVHTSVLADVIGHNRLPPVIAEIGGGYSKFFYFLSRKISSFTYLNFDLPETLCCSAYFLLKAFPDKKFLLYGEGDLNSKALQDYDFIIFPSFAVDQIPSGSVDLFLNQTSLGEMNRPTAQKFLSEIERTANYFWHMNHEFIRNEYSDGTSSLLNSEYNISCDKFQRLFRYIDSGHAIYEGGFNMNSDIYCYLYKRRMNS